MEDADFMLELKNDPATMLFAIRTHRPIKKEDHYAWLEKNVQYFKVLEEFNHTPIKVAAVRVQDNEISVWVLPKFRGMGYATTAIKSQRQNEMTAKIVKENIASMHAFIKAGFRPVELSDELGTEHYIFKYKAEVWGQK